MLQGHSLIDDKYEIIGAIGGGGFGTVYSAQQKQFDRPVAIKLLNTTILQERDGLPRFEREAKAISTLKHKNIVSFYGYGVWQQAPYIVMELVAGTSLDRLIAREGPLSPARALNLQKQILDALNCAHSSGVVHRDLKPSNIMITSHVDGKDLVKIIDFGLVKLMPGYGISGQKLTETGYALGTCHYMAPEQALGGNVDARSDIYAAGCIFYLMLTARPPFDADNNIAIMYQHINETPPPLKQLLPPEAPVDTLQTVMNNFLAKSADARYQSCTEAITDLDAFAQGKYSSIHSLADRQLAPQVRKKFSARAVVPTVVIFFAGTLILLLILNYNFNKQERETVAGVSQFGRLREPASAETAALLRDHIDSPSNSSTAEERLADYLSYCRYAWYAGDARSLRKYFLQALALKKTLPVPYPTLEAELAIACERLSATDGPIYWQDLIQNGRISKQALPAALYGAARSNRVVGNYEAALHYYLKMRNSLADVQDAASRKNYRIQAAMGLLDSYELQHRTAEAMREAQWLAGASIGAESFAAIARAYRATGKYKEALDYALESADSYEKDRSEERPLQYLNPKLIAISCAGKLNDKATLSRLSKLDVNSGTWAIDMPDVSRQDVVQCIPYLSKEQIKEIDIYLAKHQ